MRVEARIAPVASHNGFADVEVVGDTSGAIAFRHRLDVAYHEIWPGCGPVPEVHSDLLLLAAVVYAVDKAALREAAPDLWTRSFAVSLPVAEPDRWERARQQLEACVRFLTGDEWSFAFTKRASTLVRPSKLPSVRKGVLDDVAAIGLFSGGLDSLIGTIDWLATTRGTIAVVGHHDGDVSGPLSDQRGLLRELAVAYPGRLRAILPRVGISPSGEEISFRSRSILFLGLALHVAGGARPATPVLIPENGNIALNVPLTPSRQGSCSTRTAHPHYLDLLRRALATLGLVIPIVNPLEAKTKGECVRDCLNPGLLQKLYARSASCAKRGHRASWVRRNARQCGRCIPCLYRRASLHLVGWDDEQYGVDVCDGEVPLPERIVGAAPRGSEDTLAMLAFLRKNLPPEVIGRLLVSNGRIPPADAGGAAALVGRAMDEVRALVRDKAGTEVKRAAGIL